MKPAVGALAAAGVLAIGVLAGAQLGCSTSDAAATPSPAPAATFPGSRNLEKAQKEAAAGQLAAASDLATEAARELDEAAPLRVVSLRVVKTPVSGYGLWTEVPASALSISKKDTLNLYFEPAGFARRKQGDIWTSDLVADVALFAPSVRPEPFLTQSDFIGSKLDSRRANRELYYVMTLRVEGPPGGEGPPPGDYVAEVTLRDKIGGETAKATVPYKLVP